MPKRELDFSILRKKIEEQIKTMVEKIVSEEVRSEWTDEVKISYYWDKFEIEAEVPIRYETNKMEGMVDVSFKIRFNIISK